METMQSGASLMRKKTAYIITLCVMGGLLIASIVMTFSFGLLSEDTDYLQMALAVAGMLFAAILFVCCCGDLIGTLGDLPDGCCVCLFEYVFADVVTVAYRPTIVHS